MSKKVVQKIAKMVAMMSVLAIIFSIGTVSRKEVQAKGKKNLKAHAGYENQLKKYQKDIKKVASRYIENYELFGKKLDIKKVSVHFAYHDFNKDRVDELIVRFFIKGGETPLYEEIATYYKGKVVKLTENGWYDAAGGQESIEYYYDSKYIVMNSVGMAGVDSIFSQIKDGKLKQEISFSSGVFLGQDFSLIDGKEVKQSKYDKIAEKYSKKKGRYRIKSLKATNENLKKYRKTYNSKAFKEKKSS